VTVGLLAGTIGAGAALPLLWKAGAVATLSAWAAWPQWLLIGVSAAVLAAAGALYGRVFMRAANDNRGGWLFGISYGFLLWMLGPITVSQWVTGQPPVVSGAARALLASHLLFGLVLGFLFPHLHRLLMRRLRQGDEKR
jgi:hypothetical protein